jgi:hypothetical protein
MSRAPQRPAFALWRQIGSEPHTFQFSQLLRFQGTLEAKKPPWLLEALEDIRNAHELHVLVAVARDLRGCGGYVADSRSMAFKTSISDPSPEEYR